MKYIKTFEEKKFGYFDVKKGDIIKFFGRGGVYLVLDYNNLYELKVYYIGVAFISNDKRFREDYFNLFANTGMPEIKKNMKYRFLTYKEKILLYEQIIEKQEGVEIVKNDTGIDLNDIEKPTGFDKYQMKKNMKKYNL